eukprot:jgi/Botrbrau1/2120/Bobra.0093s0027.1
MLPKVENLAAGCGKHVGEGLLDLLLQKSRGFKTFNLRKTCQSVTSSCQRQRAIQVLSAWATLHLLPLQNKVLLLILLEKTPKQILWSAHVFCRRPLQAS